MTSFVHESLRGTQHTISQIYMAYCWYCCAIAIPGRVISYLLITTA
jgi:hypothetical protein